MHGAMLLLSSWQDESLCLRARKIVLPLEQCGLCRQSHRDPSRQHVQRLGQHKLGHQPQTLQVHLSGVSLTWDPDTILSSAASVCRSQCLAGFSALQRPAAMMAPSEQVLTICLPCLWDPSHGTLVVRLIM